MAGPGPLLIKVLTLQTILMKSGVEEGNLDLKLGSNTLRFGVKPNIRVDAMVQW